MFLNLESSLINHRCHIRSFIKLYCLPVKCCHLCGSTLQPAKYDAGMRWLLHTQETFGVCSHGALLGFCSFMSYHLLSPSLLLHPTSRPGQQNAFPYVGDALPNISAFTPATHFPISALDFNRCLERKPTVSSCLSEPLTLASSILGA